MKIKLRTFKKWKKEAIVFSASRRENIPIISFFLLMDDDEDDHDDDGSTISITSSLLALCINTPIEILLSLQTTYRTILSLLRKKNQRESD